MSYFVYLLASERNGTLYLGVTNSLKRRVSEHKIKTNKGFTEKYEVHILVWFAEFSDIADAIATEKRIKKWNRGWKMQLIEKDNPEWNDLYNDIA